jgi:hypothetical protein
MRLSPVQKDILYVLYGLEVRQGKLAPLPLVTLLRIVNSARQQLLADTNFRRSCHTLNQHSLLDKYRDRQSLQVAFSLSTTGREKARDIYQARINEMEDL